MVSGGAPAYAASTTASTSASSTPLAASSTPLSAPKQASSSHTTVGLRHATTSTSSTATTTSTTTNTKRASRSTLQRATTTASIQKKATSSSVQAAPSLPATFSMQLVISSNFTTTDLNQNGIPDAIEAEVVLTETATLEAGEYQFQNLRLASGAVLRIESDLQEGTGVVLHADNVHIETGAHLSADATGYNGAPDGPGTPDNYRRGASHGSTLRSSEIVPWYGSALWPRTLGSNSSGGPGGGAIEVVADTIVVDGTVSADGARTASGGSVLLHTTNLRGSGAIQAEGGSYRISAVPLGPGTGGRVALHADNYSFTGSVSVRGGRRGGSIFPGVGIRYAESGTAVWYAPATNQLTTLGRYRLQANDAPHQYHTLIHASNTLSVDAGVEVSATTLEVFGTGVMQFATNTLLHADEVTVADNGSLILSETQLTPLQVLRLTDTAVMQGQGPYPLDIEVARLEVDTGAHLSLDGAGYNVHDVVPYDTSAHNRVGASHGGRGWGNTATSTYGDAAAPTTLGTGGGLGRRGGGALKLTADIIYLEGTISANGESNSSGGSILVTVAQLFGSGRVTADGGLFGTTAVPYSPGAGGRIAVYYQEATGWTGTTTTKGGKQRSSSFSSGSRYAEDGTIVFSQIESPTEPESPCTENCHSNVLFLPGIMGSRLYEESESCDILFPDAEQERWFSMNDCDQLRLRTLATGDSIYNIYTKPSSDHVVNSTLGFNLYKSFVEDLETWQQEGFIAEAQVIPYDWRLQFADILNTTKVDDRVVHDPDSSYTESYLYQELTQLASTSRTGNVTLVTHSNGGLLAKYLLMVLEQHNDPLLEKIDALVLVGVPQVGTPSSLLGILHGDSLGPLGIITSQQTARTLMNTAPFAHHLLPSSEYFSAVTTPVVTIADGEVTSSWRDQFGTAITNSTDMEAFLHENNGRPKPEAHNLLQPEVVAGDMLTYASDVHASLDAWQPPPSMQVYQVVGTGILTPTTIEYFTDTKCVNRNPLLLFACTETGPTLGYRVVHARDGDATVASPSAGIMTESLQVERWWLDFKAYNSDNFSRQHRDMLEVPDLREFVADVVSKQIDSSYTYITPSEPALSLSDRIEFTLHSPLDLQVRSTTGVISSSTQSIVGGVYRRYGEVQFISVPVDTADLELILTGQASGSFTLEVKELQGDTSTSTSFTAIPTATSTIVRAHIPAKSSELVLELDAEGDGEVDAVARVAADGTTMIEEREVTTAAEASTTAPTSRISTRIKSPVPQVAGVSYAGFTPAELEELGILLERLEELLRLWSALYE